MKIIKQCKTNLKTSTDYINQRKYSKIGTLIIIINKDKCYDKNRNTKVYDKNESSSNRNNDRKRNNDYDDDKDTKNIISDYDKINCNNNNNDMVNIIIYITKQ